jgi:hypothetical protein
VCADGIGRDFFGGILRGIGGWGGVGGGLGHGLLDTPAQKAT